MAGGRAEARLGGIFGILYVVSFIPAYVVGYPDAPGPASDVQAVIQYFDVGESVFVLSNGVLLVFTTFFFVWFLGILHGLLRRAEGEVGGISSAALAGGVTFMVLACAGFAAEILFPATLARFENFQPDAQFVFVSLVLSSWLYHFCQVGTAVLVSATSLIALRTGVLPGWLAWAGFVVALLALLHFLLPLPAALIGLLWVGIVSVFMIAGSFATERDATSGYTESG